MNSQETLAEVNTALQRGDVFLPPTGTVCIVGQDWFYNRDIILLFRVTHCGSNRVHGWLITVRGSDILRGEDGYPCKGPSFEANTYYDGGITGILKIVSIPDEAKPFDEWLRP